MYLVLSDFFISMRGWFLFADCGDIFLRFHRFLVIAVLFVWSDTPDPTHSQTGGRRFFYCVSHPCDVANLEEMFRKKIFTFNLVL